MKLLTPYEVDRLLRYPRGRAVRLARAGRILFLRLPDGEIRFEQGEIEKLIAPAVSGRSNRRGHECR